MDQPSGTKKTTAFLIAVVVLNLVALVAMGRFALSSVERARAEMAAGLGWGDAIPWQEPVLTLDRGAVSLRPQAPATTTFLFFIDAVAVDGVQTVARDLAAVEAAEGTYRALAIFQGSEEQWRAIAPPEPPGLSIVPDPDDAIRSAFRIDSANGASTTVAVDQEARIGLFLSHLVHAGLLLDFLGFEAPARKPAGSALEAQSRPAEVAGGTTPRD
ncbi:MAG: hypothetical protein AAF560_17205, partial [Acidobacteriota bacterium]